MRMRFCTIASSRHCDHAAYPEKLGCPDDPLGEPVDFRRRDT